MNGYTAVQRRDRSDQWREAAGGLPDEHMQQNNNKTILSNDNNNNSWTGCLIISTTMLLFLTNAIRARHKSACVIPQAVRGEEGGEGRGGAYYTIHITLHYYGRMLAMCSAPPSCLPGTLGREWLALHHGPYTATITTSTTTQQHQLEQ